MCMATLCSLKGFSGNLLLHSGEDFRVNRIGNVEPAKLLLMKRSVQSFFCMDSTFCRFVMFEDWFEEYLNGKCLKHFNMKFYSFKILELRSFYDL